MKTPWSSLNTAATLIGGFFSALGVSLVLFAITKIDKFNTGMIQLEEWRQAHTASEAAMLKRLADTEKELTSHDFAINEHSRQLKWQSATIRSNEIRIFQIEKKVGL